MKVINYTVEAFDAEDYVMVCAIDEKGKVIPGDIAKKLFSLSAKAAPQKAEIPQNDKVTLDKLEYEAVGAICDDVAQRNSEFFDNEVDKLDKWADDMKTALELDLKKMDIDIKTAKTLAKKLLNLEEKLKEQRAIKEAEKKRNETRKKLYEAQDEVDNKKESLLASIESRLKQKTKREELFTIKWRVV